MHTRICLFHCNVSFYFIDCSVFLGDVLLGKILLFQLKLPLSVRKQEYLSYLDQQVVNVEIMTVIVVNFTSKIICIILSG